MSTHQHIRFSVKKEAIEDVKKLIKNYANHVSKYAKEHDEEWTWSKYQSKDSPTEFVSVISHQDAAAERRHIATDETRIFAKNLYKHVTHSEQVTYELVASG